MNPPFSPNPEPIGGLPKLRFRSLGSGSTGNCTLVEAHSGHQPRPTRLLVDCGFGIRELLRRLTLAEVSPTEIDAIFITHEHGDHVGCVLAFAMRFGVCVIASRGTAEAARLTTLPLLRLATDGEALEVGKSAAKLRLRPFTVPHDAAEPLQLTIELLLGLKAQEQLEPKANALAQGAQAAAQDAPSNKVPRLGILTDAGHCTEHMARSLAGCHALLLECNHDPSMLAQSRYPPSLQRRVGGNWGHLANAQAAAMLQALAHPQLHTVVAAHLSLQNNTPTEALRGLARALGLALNVDGQDDLAPAHPAQLQLDIANDFDLFAAEVGQQCRPVLTAANAQHGCGWIDV